MTAAAWTSLIEAIRAEDGFDGRTQPWQTFARPLPRATDLLHFRRLPVLCAWCGQVLTWRQVTKQIQCCSISCGMRQSWSRRAG